MATAINAMEIPVSTVQGINSSYTVPADRYAIVRAQVKNGGTLSIAGTVVLATTTWAAMANNNGHHRSPGTLSSGAIAATYYIQGAIMTANPANGSNGSLFTTNMATNNAAAPSSSMAQSSNASGFTGVDMYTNATATTSNNGTFKVPPGTAIVGAVDARYHIELYRVPGSAT